MKYSQSYQMNNNGKHKYSLNKTIRNIQIMTTHKNK